MMSMVFVIVFSLCIVGYCKQEICSSGLNNYLCFFNFEHRNGTCIECKKGFISFIGEACRPCPENTFGRECLSDCKCRINERCDHVKGCVNLLPSLEPDNTADHDEALELTAERYCKIGTYCSEMEATTALKSEPGTYLSEVEATTAIKSETGYNNTQSSIGTISALLMFLLLVFVSLTCFCWKYKLFYKKRGQTNITHHNVSRNFSLQADTHEYMEIDDGFFNVESQIKDAHGMRSSASSTRSNGICGVDNDGYLNSYQALKSIEITLEQEPSSEQPSTETSFIHAQENIAYLEDQDERYE